MGVFDGHSSAVHTITSRRFKPIELECNNYITNMTKQVTLHTKKQTIVLIIQKIFYYIARLNKRYYTF